jgi:tetratricopeptide (TPR) repeat protein
LPKLCRLLPLLAALFISSVSSPQETHDHGVPEKLGQVSFPISCSAQVQAEFNRGVALLHSFAYAPANAAFGKVAAEDPDCAMAQWGLAMTSFHQLWQPPVSPASLPTALHEIETAQKLGSPSARERSYIEALSLVFTHADKLPFSARDQSYEQAMAELARENSDNIEVQVFYALALLSNAPPTDKTHALQKKALAILEPLDSAYPDHPGITHYIIHACDSTELAPRGLAAARKYARVAPSAPHALHMPSHIFTRLGLWQDSIASNLAASRTAHHQGDIGEELHAMDYLVYAYLQLGRYDEAREVIDQLDAMSNLGAGDFKVGYAATAMHVRYAIERREWDDAARMTPLPGAPSYVAALSVWARGLGRTRGEHASDVSQEIAQLQHFEELLRDVHDEYWAAQVDVLKKEVDAWSDQANQRGQLAEATLRAAADEEDAMEKLPVTPGPIVPAREQLGELLLEQHRASDATVAFRAALAVAPNRRGATEGMAHASQMIGEK